MTSARCPTCAAELGGAAVCPHCGSLPGIEAAIAKAKGGVSGYVHKKVASLPRRLESHHLLWLCAVIPLFILPPLLALIYSVVAMRQRRSSINANLDWIAVVAAVNLVVSALVLYKLHVGAGDLITGLSDAVRAALRRWLGFEFPPPRPSAKTTPV